MGIWFSEKFHTARVVEFLQEFNHLRSVVFKLLNGAARERDGALEVAAIALSHFDERVESRHIRVVGSFSDRARVLVVVIIIMVCADIEETIALEMDVLVYLEI